MQRHLKFPALYLALHKRVGSFKLDTVQGPEVDLLTIHGQSYLYFKILKYGQVITFKANIPDFDSRFVASAMFGSMTITDFFCLSLSIHVVLACS